MTPRIVRSKFEVSTIEDAGDGGKTLHAHAVTSGSEENEAFYQATPSGSLSIYAAKAGVLDHLNTCDEFYLDIVTFQE